MNPTSSCCDESGIPHHPVTIKSGKEKGLQESGTRHDTGAEPCVWEEAIRENGWYWLAAVPRTVTSRGRSIWTHFLRVFLPFP